VDPGAVRLGCARPERAIDCRQRAGRIAGIHRSLAVPIYPHPIIAREGWPFVALALALAVALSATQLWFPALLAWLLAAFIVQFFRDPPRVIPQQPNAVLSAADGRIVKVGKARDPYLDRDALLISVFMNVFNVHSNRSPVDGIVANAWYHHGSFLNAALDKASLENERNALHVRTADGQDVTCVQVAGLIARRILCYAKPGDTLARGERYGFIRFGSRVDVYLTPSAAPKVAVGDIVLATETILAELPAA
jgi:phosphatidylserine decarboxylase